MNRRIVGIGIGVGLGAIAVGIGGYYGLKRLLVRPTHDVVITYHRHASTQENDERIAAETARSLALKSGRIKRIRSVSTRERVTVECSFDSKPLQYDEDDAAIKNTTEQVLHALSTPSLPPDIEPAEPESRMWVLASTDLYKQLDEIRGVTVWHGCGTARPRRLRVRLDPAKLAAYKVDAADFVTSIEHEVAEKKVALTGVGELSVKGYVTLGKVSSAIGDYVRPPSCTAVTPDGQSVVALPITLHPKTSPEDRGKLDAIVKEAKGALVGEKEYSEVRFLPIADRTMTYAQEVQLAKDFARTTLVPVIAATMTEEGFGTLIVKKEAKDADLRDLVAKKPGVGWGGIRGRPYVQITVKDKDRNAVDALAQSIMMKVSGIEGISQRIITAPPTRPELTYDVDQAKALADNVELDLVHALVPALAEQDPSLPVVFEAPSDALMIRGKPFSTYVTTRTTLAPGRLLRLDGAPAAELRWEQPDTKAMKRLRQVVGASPAVTVTEVPASR